MSASANRAAAIQELWPWLRRKRGQFYGLPLLVSQNSPIYGLTPVRGCVTVSRCQPDAAKNWKEIQDIINNTKKQKLKFIKGPHWWNGAGQTTKYGTITIK